MNKEIKEKVNDFIRKNKTKECLNFLIGHFPNDEKLSILKKRFTENESDNLIGILNRGEYSQESNKISMALLRFEPTEEVEAESSNKTKDSTTMKETQPQGPKIFISYAGEDRPHLKELKKHLSPFLRNHVIEDIWYDQEITAGSDWNNEIQSKLVEANIVLVLISGDFLSIDKGYIWKKEMPIITEKFDTKEALVIPIIVRDCAWNDEPIFSKIQAIHFNGEPLISDKHNKDAAFSYAAKQILRSVNAKFPQKDI